MSRTRRRPRTGSGRFSRGCRSHGSCPYCANGRKHKVKRRRPADMKEQVDSGLRPVV